MALSTFYQANGGAGGSLSGGGAGGRIAVYYIDRRWWDGTVQAQGGSGGSGIGGPGTLYVEVINYHYVLIFKQN